MNSKQIDAEIQARVESFVADLSELIHEAALTAVQEAVANAGLGGSATRSTKKRASKKRSSKKRASKKRSTKKRGRRAAAPSDAQLDKIHAWVKSNKGSSVGAIAEGVGMAGPATKKAVAALLEANRLRKTGQRRGTKYFAK